MAKLALADLNKQDQGLVQAIRNRYRLLHRQRKVPWAGVDWKLPFSEQFLQPEMVVYLRHWDTWATGWKPPTNVSLGMVLALLEKWAKGEK